MKSFSFQPLTTLTTARLAAFASLVIFASVARASDLPATARNGDCLSLANSSADSSILSNSFFDDSLFSDDLSLSLDIADNLSGANKNQDLCAADKALNFGSNFSGADKSANVSPDRSDINIAMGDTQSTITDGDYMDVYGKINFKATVAATPGVIESEITLTVRDPSAFVMDGETSASCGGTSMKICDITWEWDRNVGLSGSARTKLAAAFYTVALAIPTTTGNTYTAEWRLEVRDTLELRDVMSGPGIFDPRTGTPTRIAFQVPADNAYVRLDIYDRRGVLVYSYSDFMDAGYNEMTWDGITPDGGFAGDGVYLFRLTADINGAQTTSTGKIAVFKK